MVKIKKPKFPKFVKAAIYPSLYVFTLLPTTLPKSFLEDVSKVFDSLSSSTHGGPMLVLLDKHLSKKELIVKFKYLWEKGIQDYTKTIGGALRILSVGDDYQKSSFALNFLYQRRQIEIRISTEGTIIQGIRIDKSIRDNQHLLQNLFQATLKHSWTTIKDKLVEMPGFGYLLSLLREREYFPIGFSTRSPNTAFEDAISRFVPMISQGLEIAKAEKNPQDITILKSLMNIYSKRITEVASERNIKVSSKILREWESRKFEIAYEAENTASSMLRSMEHTLKKILFELDEALE